MYNASDSSAVYALNSYVWKILENNLGWDDSAGRPIIPSSQQPELMQSGKPFIVYGSAIQPSGHLSELRTESISYNIFSSSSTEANSICSLLVAVLERQDQTASDVNWWLGKEPRDTQRNVSFGSVRVIMSEMSDPADEEGGFYNALVLIEAKYTVDHGELVTRDFI